jgi:ABC-3C biological conflict system middle component
MIDVLFEQRVIQNTSLAAEAIWQAVHAAFEAKSRAEGVPLPLAFLVLPLVFHQRTSMVLAAKTQPGVLYKALADDREITVGLQTRMQAMSDRTFQALSIAFDTGLLRLDQNRERHLIPGRSTPPIAHATDEVKVIMNASKRVGHTFAELTLVQICTHLNIGF